MRRTCLFFLPALLLAGCDTKDPPPPAAGGPGPSTASGTAPPPAPKAANALAGMINGKTFIPDSVKLEGRKLTFRKGKDFFADMLIEFDLPKGDEKLEGKEWTFGGKKFEDPTLHVTARANKDDLPKTEFVFAENYTMTLTIIKRTATAVEGTINLHITKPANTSLSGLFVGVVEKTLADPLDAADALYVQGKIVMKAPWTEENFTVGFVAKSADGKQLSNSAGSRVSAGETGDQGITNFSFKPQITAMAGEKDSVKFRHTHLKPGEYWVYAKRAGVVAAWKNVTVKEGDQQTIDLEIDPAKDGSVVVTLPDEEANRADDRLDLIPQGLKLPHDSVYFVFDVANMKKGQKSVNVKSVPAGKYLAKRGDSEAIVEVTAGKEAAVTLVPKKK